MGEPAIAFLRAVNVGGRNRVPQGPLAKRLERDLGTSVRHLLQSGNLVFADVDAGGVAGRVRSAIQEETGLSIAVIVRTASQVADLLAADPWPDDEPKQVHLFLWDDPVASAVQDSVIAADWAGDEIRFVADGAWLRFAGASHSSKLGSTLERRLKVTATARNARTVADVLALARSL
jgi:uncharacterized protein (DUF1697 family)